jgi:hypothetical protein
VATLTVRIAPQVFKPILSLSALAPVPLLDGGAPPVAAGYALTGGGLFRFTAQSALHWRSEALSVPFGGIALWSDADAGRLGYPDGTVLSLPSRVRLSAPLGDAGTVLRYAQLCGQPFALAASGLYRLQPPNDGGTASWQAEALPSLGDRTFAGARLDVDGDELLLSTPHGSVVRLMPPLSCR